MNATVLNTGNVDNPFYLSVSSVSTGESILQLRENEDDPDSNLLTSANQGTNARFKLNGLQVEKSTNQAKDVIPGVRFTISGMTSGNDTVSLTLTSSSAQLYNALQDLATNYSALLEKVDTQVGENVGVLSGDFIIRGLQNDLCGITNYSGTGTISRLADLGIEMNDTVNLMQATLSLQLPLADTVLAQLESQQRLLDTSIQSLNYTIYGKQTTL